MGSRVDNLEDKIYDLEQRVEELEQQNAFECECVKERDKKLQAIKKLVASISPYDIPKEVAVKLFDVLCIVDK